ncbi:hypothetical protein Tco_1255557 [Tanacetum coccineum]
MAASFKVPLISAGLIDISELSGVEAAALTISKSLPTRFGDKKEELLIKYLESEPKEGTRAVHEGVRGLIFVVKLNSAQGLLRLRDGTDNMLLNQQNTDRLP